MTPRTLLGLTLAAFCAVAQAAPVSVTISSKISGMDADEKTLFAAPEWGTPVRILAEDADEMRAEILANALESKLTGLNLEKGGKSARYAIRLRVAPPEKNLRTVTRQESQTIWVHTPPSGHHNGKHDHKHHHGKTVPHTITYNTKDLETTYVQKLEVALLKGAKTIYRADYETVSACRNPRGLHAALLELATRDFWTSGVVHKDAFVDDGAARCR